MKLPFIDAGEIVSTHGIHGEMKILTWLDSPEDLCEFDRCQINGQEYVIEQCRVQKTCNLLKVTGIETIEAAQAMRGSIVKLYRDDIDNEVIFAAELMDMEVYTGDSYIGRIVDVLDYPGNCVYVVRGECEYMIPAVSAFILSTDLNNNRMQVNLIEGMRSDED